MSGPNGSVGLSTARYRTGRLRRREALRTLVRETRISSQQLIMPLFVHSGSKPQTPIAAMPGQYRFSVKRLVKECRELRERGVGAVLLFGVADRKDAQASGAYAADGIVQQAVTALKAQVPDVTVITDVCLCAYTEHGHCGVIRPASSARRETAIDTDASLELLAKVAVSHAQAGADMVAPSDMLDGNVSAIRHSLDREGFADLPIMAYSVKFASAFYGPFRHAVDSSPSFGDRRGHQMDIANSDEAVRRARLDLEQGADIVMVKPALAYLDLIYRLRQELHCPVAAYLVSGEYAMIKAAAKRGWMDEQAAAYETLIGAKRAGADVLITYWAKEAAEWLRRA